MNFYLSPGHSLMSHIVSYLPLEDIVRARTSFRFMKTATDEWSGNWRRRVHASVPGIVDCSVCQGMILTIGPLRTLHKSAAYCGLCNNIVCVDHLQRCDGVVCCGDC